MSEPISNNKKVTIFLFAFVVYCAVNFLQANKVWGTWIFDDEFTDTLKWGLSYLLIDLLGGDAIQFAKNVFRRFKSNESK